MHRRYGCNNAFRVASRGDTLATLRTSASNIQLKGATDTHMKYENEITALVVIDPYSDFISEGGKVWDRLKTVAEANDCVPHMLQVLTAARKAGLRGFYALHHRYRSGDYETWKYIAPIQKAAWLHKAFENGTWGGEIRPESHPSTG